MIAVILVILAAAVPNIIKFRLNAAETIVIREVQTIAQAQTQYLSQFGRYAATLAELGPAHGAADSPAAAGVDSGQACIGRKGWISIYATPKTFGSTGRRTFYLDQNGVVHENWGARGRCQSGGKAKFKLRDERWLCGPVCTNQPNVGVAHISAIRLCHALIGSALRVCG